MFLRHWMFVLNLTSWMAVFAPRYPVNTNCTSVASPITDIMKCHTALRSCCLLLAKTDPQPFWAAGLNMVEFDSELMRTDPKSTSQYQQKPELYNEGKPIWPKFFISMRIRNCETLLQALFLWLTRKNRTLATLTGRSDRLALSTVKDKVDIVLH